MTSLLSIFRTTLAALYGVECALAVIFAILAYRRAGRTMSMLFHVLVSIYCSVRLVLNALPFSVFGKIPDFIMFILDVLPHLLFFSTYCLLVTLWAIVYYKANRLQVSVMHRRFIKAYWLLMTAVYSIAGVMALLVALLGLEYEQFVMFFEGPLIAFICFGAAGAFVLYGFKLSRFVSKTANFGPSPWQSAFLKQVHSVAIVCTIANIVQALYILAINSYLLRMRLEKKLDTNVYFIIWFLFFITAEIIPSCSILFLIGPGRSRTHTRSSKSKNAHVDGRGRGGRKGKRNGKGKSVDVERLRDPSMTSTLLNSSVAPTLPASASTASTQLSTPTPQSAAKSQSKGNGNMLDSLHTFAESSTPALTPPRGSHSGSSGSIVLQSPNVFNSRSQQYLDLGSEYSRRSGGGVRGLSYGDEGDDYDMYADLPISISASRSVRRQSQDQSYSPSFLSAEWRAGLFEAQIDTSIAYLPPTDVEEDIALLSDAGVVLSI